MSTKSKPLTDTDFSGYKEAAERLIVLLAATRHEIDILESRSERLEKPLPAFMNVAKAIDKKILDAFGVSAHSLAHIVPPELRSLDSTKFESLSDSQLNAEVVAYDQRFAITERAAYLRGVKRTLGRVYRILRGAMVRLAKLVFKVAKGARR